MDLLAALSLEGGGGGSHYGGGRWGEGGCTLVVAGRHDEGDLTVGMLNSWVDWDYEFLSLM